MIKTIFDNIKEPIISEKSKMMEKYKKITFIVNKKVQKSTIRYQMEKKMNIKIIKVNTLIYKSTSKNIKNIKGKTKSFKKTIITTKERKNLNFL